MIDFSNCVFNTLKMVDNDTFLKTIEGILINGEEILHSFQTIRDGLVFTNKRIIAINVKGLSGKVKDISSLPYKNIQAYAFTISEIGDHILELWFASMGVLGKVVVTFDCGVDIAYVCQVISEYVL